MGICLLKFKLGHPKFRGKTKAKKLLAFHVAIIR